MAEELGKIEKPPVEDFKQGKKLYFVPLIYRGEDLPEEYIAIFNRYWEQVTAQIAELESKLGRVNRVYHELLPVGGEAGREILSRLSEKSHTIVQACLSRGAQLEAVEENELLTEFMDWSRCLLVGLQNQKVFTTVYESYAAVGKKRNELITRKINETLKPDEIGVFFMRENHQVQFPPDIRVFYVSPPALDEIKRWLRDHEAKEENKP